MSSAKLRIPKRREVSEEAKFAKATALTAWSTLKLNVQGRRGWPDRLCLAPDRVIVFIEFKPRGGKPDPLQSVVHSRLQALGFPVYVCETALEALDKLSYHFRMQR